MFAISISKLKNWVNEYLEAVEYQISETKTLEYIKEMKKNLSISFYRKKVYQIKKFLDYIGVTWETHIKPPQEKLMGLPKIIKSADIENCKNYFKNHEYELQCKALIMLGSSSGARAEELYSLDMKDFENDLEDVLDRAIESGMTHLVSVGVELESSLKSLELSSKHSFIYSSVGYHPHHADEIGPGKLEEVLTLTSEPKVVAWGEIGLDYFRNYSPRAKQIEVFEYQMEMAVQCNLPVIIHDRDAHRELFEIVKKYNKINDENRGVIHCFSGDYDLAMSFIELGYYISIPGTVTYSNAKNVQDVALKIPLEYLLIETDSPYLAPVPMRGRRNEPSFISQTARKIAHLRGIDFKELSCKTSENAKRLFRFE